MRTRYDLVLDTILLLGALLMCGLLLTAACSALYWIGR